MLGATGMVGRSLVRCCLVDAAGREHMLNESFDAGGPDVMTYREMIERIARIRGRHPLIMECPSCRPVSPHGGSRS